MLLNEQLKRCRTGMNRVVKREVVKLAGLVAWHLETLATKQDLAALRDELRELKRPR